MSRLGTKATWLVMLAAALAATPTLGQTDAPVNHLSEPPPQDTTQIDYEQTLIRRLRGNPNTLNPLLRGSAPEYSVLEMLYDAPFVFNERMEWGINAVVVERFAEASDHLSANLVLRPNLVWHDGKPFTAADVVFSYEQLRDPRVPATANRTGIDGIVSCKALGEHEVRFEFKEASPVSRVTLGFPLVPRHVFAPIKSDDPTLRQSDAANMANRHPVGNGPYRFVEWIDDERVVLERWDGYPGPKPHFKRIVLRILREPKSAMLALLKGEIDEMSLSPDQYSAQLGSAEFAKVAVPAKADRWFTSYIAWNADGSNPFFADARVRRAMSHALDTQQIIDSVYNGLYSAARGIYPPGSWMFNPEVKPLPYSLATASDLLDQAGWKIDARNGWRTREDRTFAFELLCPQESAAARRVLTYYQQSLRSIGVDMKLRLIEFATLRELRHKHEFQAYFGAWSTSNDPDQDRGMWHSSAIDGGANFTSYRNKSVDYLFDQAGRSFDPEERTNCYRDIHRIVQEDQPFTFVAISPSLWACNKRLRGVRFGPLGAFHWHPGPRDWWVRTGESLRPQ